MSDEAHFNLGWYVNNQNCRIWGTENPHAYIEMPTHPKRETVWCGFWSRGIIGPFLFENGLGKRSLPDYVERIFVCKIMRRIFAIFGFNRTTLSATQPKLCSMFCALFLKVALSATELMSFGHLEAAIWHRWTITCGVPSKISDTPTTQRKFKKQYSWSHWWKTAAHNR